MKVFKFFPTFFAYLPFLGLVALIFYLSSLSDLDQSPLLSLFPFSDKLAHGGIFFLLGFFAALATLTRKGRITSPAFIEAWMISAIYGALDEFHQSFVPNRDPSVGDWLADAIGALLGVMFYFYIYKKLKKRRIFSR